MRLKFWSVFILLVSSTLFAQRTVNIDADWFSITKSNRLVFYNIDNYHNYQKIFINPETHSNNRGEVFLATDTYQISKEDFLNTKSDLVNLKNLPKTNSSELFQKILDREFTREVEYKRRNKQISNSIETLRFDKNQLFSINSFSIIKNTISDTKFYNYYFININAKQSFLVFVDNYYVKNTGYAFDHESGLQIYFQDLQSNDYSYFRENLKDSLTFPKDNKEKKWEDWNKINYLIVDSNFKDIISKEKLIAKNFDSISNRGSFYLGYSGNEVTILNKKLTDITPKKIRAISKSSDQRIGFQKTIQVLTGNNIGWLTPRGSVYDSIPFNFVYSHCGFGIKQLKLSISQKEKKFLLNGNPIVGSEFYDELFFINHQKNFTVEISPYFGYDKGFVDPDRLNYPQSKYLLALKNGKWGILEIKGSASLDFTEINYQLQEVLPLIYDQISFDVVNKLFLLEKSKLFSYYGINSKPKYKYIESFNGYFARFTLANGKKGWLTKEGKEYLDE